MSVTAANGFVAGGGAIGIKDGNRPDLAIVATADGVAVPAAAVFTTNLACAAPVQVSRLRLGDGHAAAIVLSSGNANAATGEKGRRDARRMCELTGESLGIASDDVLVCSTGLIGIPLLMDPIEKGIP
ncbi:MAG: glutamate N-acetyltransferase / amino-acid N-acetyltransferase, partial [Actinomycetota bacterium]|nr:glutamate N-acetyltransferase / amino-acid N-acetyltransferase [Actinomycetota bacterium]